MIRVVFEHSPSLFGLVAVDRDADALESTCVSADGAQYYRAETKAHYVLYRRAVSGWGAVNGQTPDSRQQ